MGPPTRRDVIAAGALSMVGTLLPGRLHAADLDVIRFAYQPGFAYGLFYVAQQRGWFKQAGVSLDPMTVFTNGTIQIDAVVNGDLDATVEGFVPLLTRAAGGEPVRIIDVVDNSGRTYAVVGASKIDGIAGLKGRTVEINRGTNYDYFLGKVLEKFGIAPTDLRLVNFGDPVKAQSAFLAGQVDAIVPITTNRDAILQQRKDAKLLFSAIDFTKPPNPSKTPFAIYDLLATTQKGLARHKDGLVQVMRVFHTRVQQAVSSPATLPGIVDDLYQWQINVIKAEVTKEQILANMKAFDFYDPKQARQIVAGGELHSFLEGISAFLVSNKLLDTVPDIAKIIDPEPVETIAG